ncbi:heterokaryon incompatibility protein-domain-containing protein [Collybia nuda]|uniref:Heterokaryon incompatibility protein-domain-containing protein n=1 Tax=Collybia nuda TaxID=64659 RepID=A0A9P6CJ10_9AGAR|nr:heterokaryon incompatibility protein-domain-containing protein [Collybia nuda]
MIRLLETEDLRLTEFEDDGLVPPYAILSHVWEREEVLFEDIADGQSKRLYGYTKICHACRIARGDGFEYIWIDTCCINKENSTELSEAINSMYLWYKNARVCYVYLFDVRRQGDHGPGSQFATSRWFNRGWTLQELIAPTEVRFYAADWVFIGTKKSLQKSISDRTGIKMEIIVGDMDLDRVSVAAKMSWAADRNTTRIEDRAYSLMGLFRVHMPPLYGEKEQAFIRLQEEIIKKYLDDSIFAWTMPGTVERYSGILARSPEGFRDSCEVEKSGRDARKLYSIMNGVLQIKLPVVKIIEGGINKTLAALNCHISGKPIVITLVKADRSSGDYVRTETTTLTQRTIDLGLAQRSSLYITADYSSDQAHKQEALLRGQLRVKVPPGYGNFTTKSIHFKNISKDEWTITTSHLKPGVLEFWEPHKKERFIVIVGVRESGTAWCKTLTGEVLRSEYNLGDIGDLNSNPSWMSEGPLRDRASADLAGGWSVLVTLSSPLTQPRFIEPGPSRSIGPSQKPFIQRPQFTHLVEVEINLKSLPVLSITKQPDGHLGCLVTPPTVRSKFTIKASIEVRGHKSKARWTRHGDSYLFYKEHNSKDVGLMTLTNVNPNLRRIFLFVDPREDFVWSAMWREPWDIERVLTTNQPYIKINPYNMYLGEGKTVYATVSHKRKTGVADHTISLHIQAKSPRSY